MSVKKGVYTFLDDRSVFFLRGNDDMFDIGNGEYILSWVVCVCTVDV